MVSAPLLASNRADGVRDREHRGEGDTCCGARGRDRERFEVLDGGAGALREPRREETRKLGPESGRYEDVARLARRGHGRERVSAYLGWPRTDQSDRVWWDGA